ncbi:unnamed protein product [Rotaria sp. Silwood2]|nr:unnamed protein product [Rotaria sp. Silwood2]
MSLRSIPSHLRNPDEPPPSLSAKAATRWKRNAKKALQNYDYQQQFILFYVPSLCYKIYHIHRFTDLNVMDNIIIHFQTCSSFSVDTESFQHTSNIALIQIHSIPKELPALVLLIQLHHLPIQSSILFQKMKLLFDILCDKNKTIYSWGELVNEFKHATSFSLFSLPIPAKQINLQNEFFMWYKEVPPHCEVCRPNDDVYVTTGPSMFCKCNQSINNDSIRTCSLQNAILYTTGCFLDKSQTENTWSSMLDPDYTTLDSEKLDKMIHYASYDCISLTYIRLPLTQRWTFLQLEKTPIYVLLTDSRSILVDPDLDYISDAECSPSFTLTLHDYKQRKGGAHSRRSIAARRQRNVIRNRRRRLGRYRCQLIRYVYRRFSMKQIKEILHQLQIRFIHTKWEGNNVIIALKTQHLREQYQRQLPIDIFDKNNYYSQHRRT